jgi:hypothetical protein
MRRMQQSNRLRNRSQQKDSYIAFKVYHTTMVVIHKSEDAAASIFTFVLLFLLCAILFLMIGFGVDKITLVASNMFTGVGESQLRLDTFNVMILVFRIEPIIMLMSIGLNYWVSTLRINSSMADTSTMIIASAEMITMTFILIVFELFGGSALDNLVNFINKFPITNPDISLFAASQYISVCFYGLMFLILVGVVVQYVVTCVKTVDFSAYNTYYG